jgi:hypothetical protein
MAGLLFFVLSLRPTLWILMLCMMAAALWAGARMFRVKADRLAAVVLAECAGDHADPARARHRRQRGRQGCLAASAMRVALFVAVALYAWAAVWVLERWRGPGPAALPLDHN